MPRYPRPAADTDWRSDSDSTAPLLMPAASAAAGKQYDDGTPVLETALNLANGLEGMGLLALPYTVVLAGWLAFPIIVLVAVLSGYCACAIVACLYSKGPAGTWERQRQSYQDLGQAAFGAAGGRMVLGVQLLTLLAVAALFFVLIGNALAGAVPGRASAWLGDRGWTVLVWLVVSPTAWIPSLRQISWLSGAGVALLGGVLVVLVYAAAVASPLSPAGSGSSTGSPDDVWVMRTAELPTFQEAQGSIPCVFGMVLFSFSCHTMLPSMEAGMRTSERRHFPMVVALTFGGCLILKAVFMGVGWIAFGASTPVVVIAALDPLSLRLAATLAVTFNTALTLPMILFILQMVLNAALPPHAPADGVQSTRPQRLFASVHARRAAINLTILGLVVAVPGLAQIMAFAGSIASTAVVFLIPLSCHVRLRWLEMQAQRYEWADLRWLIAGHASVMSLGILGGVLGFSNALSKCA